jgi:hypothetical protein
MANPVVVDCVADTWTLAASSVTTGHIYIKSNVPRMYRHTYVKAGEAAPTDELTSHAFLKESRSISASAPIDVYIKAVDAAGKILVEVP